MGLDPSALSVLRMSVNDGPRGRPYALHDDAPAFCCCLPFAKGFEAAANF